MHRRTVLASTAGLLTGSVAGCLGVPSRRTPSHPADTATPSTDRSVPAGTWQQVGYDARHRRFVADARGPHDGATVAWEAVGDRAVYPPVVGESVFLTEAWTEGAALALAPGDGSRRWSNDEFHPIRWAPALSEDRLLVLTRSGENIVRLHALDTGTGEPLWVREEGITASSGKHPPVGPTVRDGSVYVASNRGIVACRAATGDVEWTATLGPHVVETDGGPTWRTDWAKPAVTAQRAFTFDTNENYRATREVYAVDRASGRPDWTADLSVGDGWYLDGHVVAGPDRIFVKSVKPHVSTDMDDEEWSGAERLFALEATSGTVAWEWDRPQTALSLPAYADGTLYVGEWYPEVDVGRLHALDVADGRIRWTYETPAGAVRSPTVASDTVYVVQGTELAAVARAGGTRRWRMGLGRRVGPPVVVGDTVYLRTNPGPDYESEILAIREP